MRVTITSTLTCGIAKRIELAEEDKQGTRQLLGLSLTLHLGV